MKTRNAHFRSGAAAALIAAALLAGPAQAQLDARPLQTPDEDTMTDEAERAVRRFLELVAPMMRELEQFVQDLPAYHPPEILPNGDIIMRRKRADEIEPPFDTDVEPEDQTKT